MAAAAKMQRLWGTTPRALQKQTNLRLGHWRAPHDERREEAKGGEETRGEVKERIEKGGWGKRREVRKEGY